MFRTSLSPFRKKKEAREIEEKKYGSVHSATVRYTNTNTVYGIYGTSTQEIKIYYKRLAKDSKYIML